MNTVDHLTRRIRVWTDGGCYLKTRCGAAAYVALFHDGRIEEHVTAFQETTNGRMEVQAALLAMRDLPKDRPLLITSDAQYLVKGATEWIPGWVANDWYKSDKKMVLNRDLWQEYLALRDARTAPTEFAWVKGHTGNHFNEVCDKLCTKARVALEKELGL